MLETAGTLAVVSATLLVLAVGILAAYCRLLKSLGSKATIAFFHPYWYAFCALLPLCAQHRHVELVFSNSGGGGERVLWVALAALSKSKAASLIRVVIYTGDSAPAGDILQRAKDRFDIDLISNPTLDVKFQRLSLRWLVEASLYPRFTMLGQSVGSMLLAVEALLACPPAVFIDTTGFAFAYPVAKVLAGCPVVTYTHYPTITSEMLQRVHEARPTYNNDASITASTTLTSAKLLYYKAFASLYSLAGRCADVVMVNSSWTKKHVDALWGRPASVGQPAAGALVVFPPCNTTQLQTAPLNTAERLQARVLVSVGQFRPEKDHRLQLAALAALRSRGTQYHDVKLQLVGGCRHAEDMQLVEGLKVYAAQLGVTDAVQFKLNEPFPQLMQALCQGTVGLHTMWNEHFGIGVVEMMAAGMVTVAHNSGGPKADIIVPSGEADGVGFLAATAEEYADAIAATLDNAFPVQPLVERARQHAARFSDEAFEKGFMRALLPALDTVLG